MEIVVPCRDDLLDEGQRGRCGELGDDRLDQIERPRRDQVPEARASRELGGGKGRAGVPEYRAMAREREVRRHSVPLVSAALRDDRLRTA